MNGANLRIRAEVVSHDKRRVRIMGRDDLRDGFGRETN